MVNVQNEICYAIARNIIKNLWEKGCISRKEYDAAHRQIVLKYRPFSVCE